MKKVLIISILLLFVTCIYAQDVMKKLPDGTYVVNTTTIAKDVNGYNGATPVEIYIKNDVITKVVPLKNEETPRFFDRVKQEMISKYSNISVNKLTGATYSSKAVQENVQRGLDYYKKHKK